MYKNIIKPIFDFVLSLSGILFFLPIFLFISIILFFEYKGEIFFIQERPGKNEKPIKILKFRSMNNNTDDSGNLLPNHLRITKFGNFLRKTSLDELPQLVNVLKGDLSLIGPRPLLKKYLPLYSPEQRRRHEIKPGITGLAQINGRNSISWSTKFKYDIHYVDNISFLLDLSIFIKTVYKVISANGVNAQENITMEPFNGNN